MSPAPNLFYHPNLCRTTPSLHAPFTILLYYSSNSIPYSSSNPLPFTYLPSLLLFSTPPFLSFSSHASLPSISLFIPFSFVTSLPFLYPLSQTPPFSFHFSPLLIFSPHLLSFCRKYRGFVQIIEYFLMCEI